jgi:16S rRNA (guanine(527)-N(7))-methyltransferase RsmG
MFAQPCGRGGTGRRAGLRSLLPQGSGSSILLVRTKFERIRIKEKVLCPFCFFQQMARTNLIGAIREHGPEFGLNIPDTSIERLADHYDLVLQHNPILHLVGPCTPEEFATRHILESLTLLTHLPQNSEFVDIGAGAGLPSIPCLIVRNDLHGRLIESKEKKAKFLNAATGDLGLVERTDVVNRQFEEASPGDAKFVTCRALDKFVERLPRLLKWCGDRDLLFFGGSALGDEMRRRGLKVEAILMPLSERRFLFVAKK